MSDFRQQQEQDEQQACLWFALCTLRPFLSPDTYTAAEREIGMNSSGIAAAHDSSNQQEQFQWH